MPKVLDYGEAMELLRARRIACVYPHSGALGFEADVATHSVGWIGPDDPTIRPDVRRITHSVSPPFETNLARLLVSAWQEILPGVAWVMPASHWAFELDFGSASWLPDVLRDIGVDPAQLEPLTTGAPIEFAPDESAAMEQLACALLERLAQSDFTIAFPDHPVICRLHHHKQLWWTGADALVIDALRAISSGPPGSSCR
jgi:hypothetical protein